MSGSVSSYIPTGNASGTRNLEQLSFPFLAIPQAMTVYVKLRLGQIDLTTQRAVVNVGSTGAINPRFILSLGGGSNYRAIYQNAAGAAVWSGLNSALTVGSLVEMRATLAATGSVQLGLTINGSTESLAVASAAQALTQTWAAPKLMINSAGGAGVQFAGYVAVAAMRGVQSLDLMRRIAGTHTRNG